MNQESDDEFEELLEEDEIIEEQSSVSNNRTFQVFIIRKRDVEPLNKIKRRSSPILTPFEIVSLIEQRRKDIIKNNADIKIPKELCYNKSPVEIASLEVSYPYILNLDYAIRRINGINVEDWEMKDFNWDTYPSFY